MSDDIFCGVGKVPSGKRRGTMLECFEKKQVRYWGVKKIDSRILNNYNKSDAIAETKTKLLLDAAKISGRIKRLQRELENDKNTKSEIENIKKEIKLNKDRRSRMKKQLDILNAKAKGEKVAKATKKITKKKTIEKKPKKGSKSTKSTKNKSKK